MIAGFAIDQVRKRVWATCPMLEYPDRIEPIISERRFQSMKEWEQSSDDDVLLLSEEPLCPNERATAACNLGLKMRVSNNTTVRRILDRIIFTTHMLLANAIGNITGHGH